MDINDLDDQSVPPQGDGIFVGWQEATAQFRRMLFAAKEDSVAIVGPPRVGKTSGILLPQALSWRGSLVSASTKPDVLRATRGSRLELAVRQGGDVFVYAPTDPRDVICGVRKIHWSPIDGCEDSTTCGIRVRRMLGPEKPNQNNFFREQGESLLRGYFHAAALASLPMRAVKKWIGAQDTDEPIQILHHFAEQSAAAEHYANDLEGIGRQAAETKGGTFGEARAALAAVSASAVALENCEYTDFDVDHFLQSGSTLYVISEEDNQQLVAPLVAGLVEAIVSRAYRMAAQSNGGRIEPPLLLLLDEVGAIAPLPSLPSIMSQGAGQGVLCTWASQDIRQLKARWGEDWAGAIWSASTHKILFGGIADQQLLEQISHLLGEYDRRVPLKTGRAAIMHAIATKGGDPGTHISKERVLPVTDMFRIPPGQALLLAQTPQGVQHAVVGTPRADLTPPFAYPVQAEAHVQGNYDVSSTSAPDALREHAILNRIFAEMPQGERTRFSAEEQALVERLGRGTPAASEDPTLRAELDAVAVLQSLAALDQAIFRRQIVGSFATGRSPHFTYTAGLSAGQQPANRSRGSQGQGSPTQPTGARPRSPVQTPQSPAKPTQQASDQRQSTQPSKARFGRRNPDRY